jgi:hypothetical protein
MPFLATKVRRHSNNCFIRPSKNRRRNLSATVRFSYGISPCPPEAFSCVIVFCLRRARGLIPLASPVAPQAVRSAVCLRACGAALPVRSKAVQRAAGVSEEHAMRALRVQGDHLPARRRRLQVWLLHASDGQGE